MFPTRRMTRTPCVLEVEATCLERGRTRCILQVFRQRPCNIDSVVGVVTERRCPRVYPSSHVDWSLAGHVSQPPPPQAADSAEQQGNFVGSERQRQPLGRLPLSLSA